tara:strand:- start:221 stop:562 length:342 start_codon:yes stop_codon:yes gene_type:complete
MPISRYKNNQIVVTDSFDHEELLNKRNVSQVTHFSFYRFKELKIRDVLDLNILNHTWESSDRLFKLSYKYYGDPTYWWVIAYFNGKPLETDFNLGQIVEIPTPLEKILTALEY